MSLLIGRALLVGLALGLSIAVVALAARGAGLGLIVAWLVAIVVTWRWFHPALLVYVFLLPLSLDYVGVAFPKIFEVNGSRLLSLLFFPGFLLALAADPAGVRALLRPLPLAVGLFWLTVSVTPLWSAGQVTLTGAIRDGLVDGIDFVLPCLVVLASLRRPAQARALVIALLAGGLLLVGVGSWEFATGANPFVQLRPLLQGGAAWAELLRRGGLPRIEAGFGGPLSLGRYLAMLAPLAMWLSVGSERQRWRWAWAVVAAALALGVLMTLSAGPAVVLGLGLLFGLGLGWRACLPSLLLIGLTAGTFLLLLPTSPEVREVAGAWVSLETPVSAETRHNLSFRFQVLELARYGLEHSPLLGYGNYGSIPVLFEEQDIINTYAVYLLKNGLVGLAAYLGVFGTLLLTVGRLVRAGGPVGRLAWVLGAVVLAQMVGLLSISPVGPGERMFWVVLGLAGALPARAGPSAREMKLGRGQIVANTAALTLAQLMPRLSGLVMVPVVARTLGSEQLGSYQLAHLILSYAALLILVGLGPLAVREIAAYPERSSDVFGEVLVTRLLLAGPALLGVAALLFGLRYPPTLITVGMILSVSVFSSALHDTADLVFQAHERAHLTALLTLLGQSLYLLLGLALLGAGAGIIGLAAAYTTAMAGRSVATLALLTARYGRARVRWQLNLGRQRRLLSAGFPFFVQAFGAHLINRIDALLLSVLVPIEVVGWYLAAYLFVEVALYLPTSFGLAVYPRLARAAPGTELGNLTCRALRLLILVVLPLPGWIALLAPWLIGLLFGAAFAPAVELLQVLIWSLPPVAYSVVVGRAVFARGGQIDLMKVQLVGLAVNVVANLLLIPRFGAIGAALCTVGTFTLIAVLHLWQDRRYGCAARPRACARFLAPTAVSWLTIWLLLPIWPWPLALLAGLSIYSGGVVGGAVRGGWVGVVREVGDLLQVSPRPLAQPAPPN